MWQRCPAAPIEGCCPPYSWQSSNSRLDGGSLTALSKSKPRKLLVAIWVKAFATWVGNISVLRRQQSSSNHFILVDMSLWAEKITHVLRACIEITTIVMTSRVQGGHEEAFSMVSFPALLSECSTHFPELLSLAIWGYSCHPNHLVTPIKKNQQGGPLSPMFFPWSWTS